MRRKSPPPIEQHPLVRAYSYEWNIVPEREDIPIYVLFVMDAYALDGYRVVVNNAGTYLMGPEADSVLQQPPLSLEEVFLAAPSLDMQQVLHMIVERDYVDVFFSAHMYGFTAYKRLLQRKMVTGEDGWYTFVTKMTRLGYIQLPAHLVGVIPFRSFAEVRIRQISASELIERKLPPPSRHGLNR